MSTSRGSRRRRGPARFTVVKDVASFVLAWGIIYLQALRPAENPWPLLLTAGGLLGVPGASEVISRIRSGTQPSGSGAPSQESLSPSDTGDILGVGSK